MAEYKLVKYKIKLDKNKQKCSIKDAADIQHIEIDKDGDLEIWSWENKKDDMAYVEREIITLTGSAYLPNEYDTYEEPARFINEHYEDTTEVTYYFWEILH